MAGSRDFTRWGKGIDSSITPWFGGRVTVGVRIAIDGALPVTIQIIKGWINDGDSFEANLRCGLLQRRTGGRYQALSR